MKGIIKRIYSDFPNDPKLSDRRSGRGTCRWVERWRWSAAGAVTAEPVRCSAWLAVADIPNERLIRVARPRCKLLSKAIERGNLALNEEAGLRMSGNAAAVVAGKLKCGVADRIVKKRSQQKVIGPVFSATTKLVANLFLEVARERDETLSEVVKVGWIDVEILPG